MTLQELSKYYDLRQALARDEGILESLRAAAEPGAQVITGMPHAPGVSDRVGDLAIEIADMEAKIAYLRGEAETAGAQVEAFIATITDDQTRMVFRLRFLRCLMWKEVASILGGGNTEEGVKKICYRYLGAESCPDLSRDVP